MARVGLQKSRERLGDIVGDKTGLIVSIYGLWLIGGLGAVDSRARVSPNLLVISRPPSPSSFTNLVLGRRWKLDRSKEGRRTTD